MTQKLFSVALMKNFVQRQGSQWFQVAGWTSSPWSKVSGIALKPEGLLNTGICPWTLHSHWIFCLNPWLCLGGSWFIPPYKKGAEAISEINKVLGQWWSCLCENCSSYRISLYNPGRSLAFDEQVTFIYNMVQQDVLLWLTYSSCKVRSLICWGKSVLAMHIWRLCWIRDM